MVAHGVDLDDLFAAVAVEAAALVDDEAVTLVRIDDHRAYTVVASHRGRAPVGTRIEMDVGDVGVVAEIMRTAGPARCDNHRRHRARAFAPDDCVVGSNAGVPIIVADVLWGVLVVSTSPGREVLAAAESTMVQFADLVAAAVANCEAHAQVQALAEEQTALHHIANLVVRGAGLDEVFAALAAEASRLIGGFGTGLVRLEIDNTFLLLATANCEIPLRRIQPYPRTPLGDLLRTGAPARIASFEGTPLAGVARKSKVQSAVAVPITVEGRLWGAMTINATTLLPADVEGRLAKFAELAGAAIANAENKAKLIASRARVVATADDCRCARRGGADQRRTRQQRATRHRPRNSSGRPHQRRPTHGIAIAAGRPGPTRRPSCHSPAMLAAH